MRCKTNVCYMQHCVITAIIVIVIIVNFNCNLLECEGVKDV